MVVIYSPRSPVMKCRHLFQAILEFLRSIRVRLNIEGILGGWTSTCPSITKRIRRRFLPSSELPCEQNNDTPPRLRYRLIWHGYDCLSRCTVFPGCSSLDRLQSSPFRGLASGFLTGKLVNNEHEGTRLGVDHPLGKTLQRLFDSDELLRAIKKFQAAVKAHGISPVEAAVRWLAHNSALEDDDSIILGASKKTQVVEVVDHIQKGLLSTAFLKEVEELWDSLKSTRGKIL